MHHDPSSCDRLQDHEMVHIPVHDLRQMQLPEVVDFKAKWSAGELHLACHLNYCPERDAFQRHRMAPPKRVQIDAMSVIRADHGQAGEPTFGRLGLLDNRQDAPAAEIQQAHHDPILTLSSGWRIQVISERFSRMISALRSISAWSGTCLP